MEAIRIEFQPNLKSKIIELLSTFSPDELKIVEENSNFELNKRNLEVSLEKLNNGTAQFYSLEEIDLIMNDIFYEYDSKIK
jgi:hypothetical protein